ncbi:Protein POLLENLESS 3-LIKE 2 [Raphanus sativus]|nr:Protein POLLENLESS 3-LIKE 2 [Raphanus sativus]
MFVSSSIWQPQPFREQSVKPKAKPDLSNGGYGDENMKTNVNANLISNNEKLKMTRWSSQTMGMLSCGGGDEGETSTKRRFSMEKVAIDSGLPDRKEFEESWLFWGQRRKCWRRRGSRFFRTSHCPP